MMRKMEELFHSINFLGHHVVDRHADESAGRQERIHFSKNVFLDPPPDILGEKLGMIHGMVFKKHFGKIMAFQGAIEKQAHESGVGGVFSDEIGEDGFENLAVILGINGLFRKDHLLGAVHPFLDDGPAEGGFRGKVFEHERFADVQPFRDLPGGGSAKPFLREETPGANENLLPAPLGRHALFHFFPSQPDNLVITH